MNMEEWKDIKGLEGIAKISNYGRVKSLDRYCWNGKIHQFFKGEIRKQKVHKGYNELSIRVAGITHRVYTHREVAKAFIPNPENKPCVNHIDGNKLNNKVENLEWVTHKENIHHAIYVIKTNKQHKEFWKHSPRYKKSKESA